MAIAALHKFFLTQQAGLVDNSIVQCNIPAPIN
jgi:hypothetical protein